MKFKSSNSKLHPSQFSHQLHFVSQRQLLPCLQPIGCHQPTGFKAQICELPQLEDTYERSYGLLIKCQSHAEKTYLLIAKMGSLVLEGFSTSHYFVSLHYLAPALTTTTDPWQSILHATTTEHHRVYVSIVSWNFQSSSKHIWLVVCIPLPMLCPTSKSHIILYITLTLTNGPITALLSLSPINPETLDQNPVQNAKSTKFNFSHAPQHKITVTGWPVP